MYERSCFVELSVRVQGVHSEMLI